MITRKYMQGVTLMELMIVVVIIGILTANIASFFIEPPAGATGEDDEGSADETDVPDASIDATVGPDVALPTDDTSVEQLVTRMAALDAKLDRVLARLDADPG